MRRGNICSKTVGKKPTGHPDIAQSIPRKHTPMN